MYDIGGNELLEDAVMSTVVRSIPKTVDLSNVEPYTYYGVSFANITGTIDGKLTIRGIDVSTDQGNLLPLAKPGISQTLGSRQYLGGLPDVSNTQSVSGSLTFNSEYTKTYAFNR